MNLELNFFTEETLQLVQTLEQILRNGERRSFARTAVRAALFGYTTFRCIIFHWYKAHYKQPSNGGAAQDLLYCL